MNKWALIGMFICVLFAVSASGAALVETGKDEIWTISDRPDEEDWVLVLRAATQN
jgi:hypothetical protein